MRRPGANLMLTALAVGVAFAGCGAGGGRATDARTTPGNLAGPSRSSEQIAPLADAPPSSNPVQVIAREPAQALRRRGAALNLTSTLPRSVRRACTAAAAKSHAVVYCPPLVPTGHALVAGVDGILRSRDFRSGFVANFESHSVQPSRSAPGHWTIAEGDPQALRALLHPLNYDPRQGSIKQRPLRIARISATLWLMPSFRIFHGIYGGHAVATWECTGREYQLSMHGHSNAERAVLIAAAMADELPSSCRR